jgi:uncharacterized protein (TIGR03435 family)
VVQPGHFAATTSDGRVRIAASKLPISRLAEMLANQLGRPVLAKTGLAGAYDYKLEFSPEGLALDKEDALSLLTAVQEQLGLRLEQKQGPIDVLVIDHVEKTPTEN